MLKELGEFGRYQKTVYFFLFLPTVFSAIHKQIWVFIGASPDHRCRMPGELDDGGINVGRTYLMYTVYVKITPYSSGTQYNLSAFAASDNCYYNLTHGGGNVSAAACDAGYVYDTTYFKSSAVMDWDLVCDQR